MVESYRRLSSMIGYKYVEEAERLDLDITESRMSMYCIVCSYIVVCDVCYSIPPFIEYPLIEYSNILNTTVVHGLGSLPKIIKLKGCIQFDLLNTKISPPFFQSGMERFLIRVEWYQLPRSVRWYAVVYSNRSITKIIRQIWKKHGLQMLKLIKHYEKIPHFPEKLARCIFYWRTPILKNMRVIFKKGKARHQNHLFWRAGFPHLQLMARSCSKIIVSYLLKIQDIWYGEVGCLLVM